MLFRSDNAVVEGEVASVPDYDATAQLERRVESARPILRMKPSTVFRTKAAPASAAERTAPSPVRVPIERGTSGETPLLASIKVLSGTNAGRTILLDKPQLTIGRPGVQVAAIVRNGASWRLKLIEGEPVPPSMSAPSLVTESTLPQAMLLRLRGYSWNLCYRGKLSKAASRAIRRSDNWATPRRLRGSGDPESLRVGTQRKWRPLAPTCAPNIGTT